MYLKALELRGFKSFPDKTRLEFEKGVTAVVGPNGSGKSNISDAVRWVLGEMSPKSLRGSKMEDVIFAGTAKRSQTGFCEVSIIIDNSASELPNDAAEVKVTRKFFRSGDSEYRINDKPSRLKDIYELFLNTGIGREGYSVIGQGKIAEVLSQKSDERRHIFEEAAGISKYRYRKNDAQKKLAETDTNLVRLTDIASEISTRLGPLEKDAENAKKYLVLAEQKKNLEVALWLERLSKADASAKRLENEHAEAAKNYADKERKLELSEAALDGLFNKKQFVANNAENTRREISELEEEKNRLEKLRSISENDVSHINERKNEVTAGIRLAETETANEIETELAAAVAKKEEKSTALASHAAAINALRARVAEEEQKRDEIDASLEKADADIRALSEKVTDLKIREAAELNSEKSEAERKSFLQAEIEKQTAELEQTYTFYEAAETRKKDCEAEKKQLEADIAAEKSTLDELQTKKEAFLRQKNEYAAAYAADTHRRETLVKMDALLEGYPGSVKAVMNASTLSGICGPVSRLLTVDGEYVTAIETALGAAVSNIIVEDETAAKAAIRHLKDTHAGRATFLPLTSISGKTLQEPTLASCRGYIGVASTLVSCDKKYDSVAAYLLGRTVVADNLDNASAMARKFGFRYKIVTLDGQVVNAGGSYTGGSAAFKTGVMSRSSDIAALDKTIAETLACAKKLNAEIAENEEAIAESTAYLESLQNDLANAQSSLYRSENDMALHKEHIDACSARLKDLNAKLDESDSAKIKERLTLLSAKRAEAELDAEEAAQKRAALDHAADEVYETFEQAKKELAELQLTALGVQKDVENAAESIRLLENKRAENQKKISALKEEKDALEKRLSGIAFDMESGKKALEDAVAAVENAKKTLAALLAETEKLERSSVTARESQKGLMRDKEVFFEQMTRLAASLENSRNEYDTLTAKLFEEYSLSYSEAIALNLPKPEPGADKELASVKGKIRALGHINVGAVEEYKETKERFDFMSTQINDLEEAKKSLENVISRLESDMKRLFAEAVEKIGVSFKRVFTELFGGGSAEIVITDPENMLESGIEINIQPPGKTVKNISLLSGGEQAFTAIALYFAILEVNPAPFYIFDEIEAALDDVNVNRFAAYVKKHADTQFIIITHRRGTMEVADTMYGVTMQEKGVSSFLKVNMEDVESKTGVKL